MISKGVLIAIIYTNNVDKWDYYCHSYTPDEKIQSRKGGQLPVNRIAPWNHLSIFRDWGILEW